MPKARLTEGKLKKLGMSQADVALALSRKERLGNLQLLDGLVNKEKSKKPLFVFIAAMTSAEQVAYPARHDIAVVPKDESQFNNFFELREAAIRAKLEALVTV